MEQIVSPEAHDRSYGNIPVQPDEKSRAWAVNSFAQLPVHGGEFSEGAAEQM